MAPDAKTGADYCADYCILGNAPPEYCEPMATTTTTTGAELFKLGYTRKPKSCVNGYNLALYHGKTVEQCEAICDATPSCAAFEYGVPYGGPGRYRAGDCSPQNAVVDNGCDGEKNNLDFYVPKVVYVKVAKCCVNGHNLALFHGQSVQECAKRCEFLSDRCVAFEYGVPYGGAGRYVAGDCSLQDSIDYSGCDGGFQNLDLHIKQDDQSLNVVSFSAAISAREEGKHWYDNPDADGQSVLKLHRADEQIATQVTTYGKFIKVWIGMSVVIGVIMGMKWQKSSAARKVQVKPLLG